MMWRSFVLVAVIMVLKTGPSIKDVRKDGVGVWSNGDTCREGVKDLADVRKDGTF